MIYSNKWWNHFSCIHFSNRILGLICFYQLVSVLRAASVSQHPEDLADNKLSQILGGFSVINIKGIALSSCLLTHILEESFCCYVKTMNRNRFSFKNIELVFKGSFDKVVRVPICLSSVLSFRGCLALAIRWNIAYENDLI